MTRPHRSKLGCTQEQLITVGLVPVEQPYSVVYGGGVPLWEHVQPVIEASNIFPVEAESFSGCCVGCSRPCRTEKLPVVCTCAHAHTHTHTHHTHARGAVAWVPSREDLVPLPFVPSPPHLPPSGSCRMLCALE